MTKDDVFGAIFLLGLMLTQAGFILLHVAGIGPIASWGWLYVMSPILGALSLAFGISLAGGAYTRFRGIIARRRAERYMRLREERQREWETEQRHPALAKRLN